MSRAAELGKLRRQLGHMHEEGMIAWPQVLMILRTMHLSELRLADVCVPRSEIDAVEKNAIADTVKQIFVESGVSRLPVYDQTLDHIVGILYARDWIHFDLVDGYDLSRLCRPAVFLSETLPVLDALSVMRHKRVSIAICTDEYGGNMGLITLEDIIEEVFDEIEDEYDVEEPFILAEHPGEVVLDAAMPLDDFCQRFALITPDVPVDTVGGFVAQEAGHIPPSGDQAQTILGTFVVLHSDGRRLRRLRWLRPEEPAQQRG